MFNKKLMIISIFLISLMAVSAVNAADNATGDIINAEETTDEVVSVEDTQEILNEDNDVGTFTDLAKKIANSGINLTLTRNYTYNADIDSKYINGIVVNSKNIFGNGITIDGSNQARIFNVSSYSSFHNLNFVNSISDNGGAIIGTGSDSFAVFNSNFTNNHATLSGGAIYNGHALSCSFTNNTANSGGAIYRSAAENCNFTNNAANSGGAVYEVYATDCIFINNTADFGGAIYEGTAIHCTFSNNSANFGGAIYNNLYSSNCIFINNFAADSYGAIYKNSAVNCTFINNHANNYSGALGFGHALYSIFINNFALQGGALGSSHANYSYFENNHADEGGAMFGGDADKCNFTGNYANQGGAISGKVQASNCSFENNYATEKGGAIFDSFAKNCNFTGNHAKNGGAIYDGLDGTSDCNFINNSAEEYGGALYGTYADKCDFELNSANFGGAISSHSSASNSSFVNNTAKISGGNKFDSYVFNCTYDGKLPQYTLYCPDITATEGYGTNMNVKMYDAPGYYVDGERITVNVYDDKYALVKSYSGQTGYNIFIDLPAGKYHAIVSGESDAYDINSINVTVTIKKATFIYAENVTCLYNSGKNIVAILKDRNGNAMSGVELTIKLNGKTYTRTTDKNGQVKLSTDGLAPNRYAATITYDGDDVYENSSTSITVTIKKEYEQSKIYLRNALYFVLQTKIVQVTLWDANNKPIANRTVHIQLNNDTWKYSGVTDENGNAYIRVGVGYGVHNATVSFDGDENYAASERTGSVRVIKETPSVMVRGADSQFKTSDNPKVVKVHLRDRYNKPLPANSKIVIKVNGQTYVGFTDSQGIASIRVELSHEGTFDAQVMYGGNSAYNPVTRSVKIYVK